MTSRRSGPSRPAIAAALAFGLLAGVACSATSTSSPSTTPQTGPVGKESDAGPAKPGGAMTIGIVGETDSYAPSAGAWSLASYSVANAVLEPLVSLDPDSN